jgi:arylsulfatase A-like enzyme
MPNSLHQQKTGPSTSKEKSATDKVSLNRRQFCSALAKGSTLLAAGCNPVARPKHLNVVLIVLDTVRAANCSGWGYPRRTTPNLDALMGHATQYRRAYATSSWTLPSHASMFTGLRPFEHQVRAYKNRAAEGITKIAEPPLNDAFKTVAESLKEKGYATAGYAANTGYLRRAFNLHQGLDTYIVKRLPGVAVARPALAWVEEVKDQPFFLFLNFMDAHRPYYTKTIRGVMDESVSSDRALLDQFMENVLPGDQPINQKLKDQVTRQYDMGIANADRALGTVLDKLKALRIYDNTLVIAVSDHGEFLGEHHLVEHSKDVYEPALHVPLVVKRPRQQNPYTVQDPVSIAQIHPTILEAVHLRSQGPYAPLSPAHGSLTPVTAELYFTRGKDLNDPRWGHRFDRVRTAIYDGPWKFIHSSDDDHALYQLNDDPEELQSLFKNHPENAGQMLKRLQKINPMPPENTTKKSLHAPSEITQEETAELRALGYL